MSGLIYLLNMISNHIRFQMSNMILCGLLYLSGSPSNFSSGPVCSSQVRYGSTWKNTFDNRVKSQCNKIFFSNWFSTFQPPHPPPTHTHTLYPHQHHHWGNIFQSCVWNFASDGGHLAAAWVRGHSGLVYPGQALKLGREILPCSRQQGSRQPQGSSPQSGLTFMNEPIREGFQKSTKLNVL